MDTSKHIFWQVKFEPFSNNDSTFYLPKDVIEDKFNETFV